MTRESLTKFRMRHQETFNGVITRLRKSRVDIEGVNKETLQGASFVVNGDRLTITDRAGNSISFQTMVSLPPTTMCRLY